MNPEETLKIIEKGTADNISVKELGASGRASLFHAPPNFVQIIDRTSRFLRKDADRFQKYLALARAKFGQQTKGVVVIKGAPVCSKARVYLEDSGVQVLQLS